MAGAVVRDVHVREGSGDSTGRTHGGAGGCSLAERRAGRELVARRIDAGLGSVEVERPAVGTAERSCGRRGDTGFRVGERVCERERPAAGDVTVVVDRRAALECGTSGAEARKREGVRRRVRVDFRDVRRGGAADVADVVGQLLAVLVAMSTRHR